MENCAISNIPYGSEQLAQGGNKYVYVKQNFVPSAVEAPAKSVKVLVNPHFNKKVFVNPNYKPNNPPPVASSKILINPNVTTLSLPKENGPSKIHINPKILKTLSEQSGSTKQNSTTKILKTSSGQSKNISPIHNNPAKQPITYSSKTKLIRKPVKEQTLGTTKRIRRSSIYSKFKIVKSSAINKSPEMKPKNRLLFTKYKLKLVCIKPERYLKSQNIKLESRFKLDNRRKRLSSNSSSKFVFINKLLNNKDKVKKVPVKSKNLVNISGIIYKNSPNRLQKASLLRKYKMKNTPNKIVKKNRFKIVRSDKRGPNSENKKILKKGVTSKKRISLEKLKKCNIPCPYYRKFGKCKGEELGKCPRKHDPDQIALCTKFLQGACIDSKCLLSHNVSPEKMPTCKYYLEGSCSKDNCPYLHVRISPKADICRDFLEGFCKMASECDKRHQFLCPDYEKKGACLKPRCSYPHGRMVRKYSVFNKHKFAKKNSANKENAAATSKTIENNKNDEFNEIELVNNARYYSDRTVENGLNSVDSGSVNEVDLHRHTDFRLRPKLGELPSFISFGDT